MDRFLRHPDLRARQTALAPGTGRYRKYALVGGGSLAAAARAVARRASVVQPGGMGISGEPGAGQYHFDPATYLAMVLAEVPAYRDLQHQVAEAARGIDAGSILELGVGTGETASVVLAVHPGVRLVGIDESEPMLALARDRFPTADLRVQRLEDPLPEGSYDLVVSALAVHHLDNAAKSDLFCRVHAQLRSGGRFVLADVVVPDDPEDAVTPVGPPHDKPSPLADQLSWLQQAGLQPTVRWQHKDLVVIAADA